MNRLRQTLEQPEPSLAKTVVIAVLAAGRSSRMEGSNKLLAQFDGVPLVRRSVQRARLASEAPPIVVTGHMAEDIRTALAGLDFIEAPNPAYAEGMGGSIGAAVRAADDTHAAIMILLADMPLVTAEHMMQLISTWHAAGPDAIVRAMANGVPGNPVILPRQMFNRLRELKGDMGARQVLEESGLAVFNYEIGEAASVDVDTLEMLTRYGGVPTSAQK